MISLVIPVFNEESLITQLFERVRAALTKITNDFEVILVDDGSIDNTFLQLKECNLKDNRFKVLSLSRNFGHPAAYTAGLTYARGSFIAMMDGDLQDPPELLEEMYNKLKNGDVDIVYGKRTDRNEKFSRRIYINLFHLIYKKFAKLQNIEQVGNFSMMSRKALEAFLSMQERNRYLPGLRAFIGFKQDYVEYSRPERSSGDVKMSTSQLLRLALDAIFSFSSLPVKICFYSGVVGIILIFLAVVYILIGKMTGMAPLGWSSIILSIYFIGSVQLLSIGILGEYIYRIYKETQARPVFFVRQFID